MGKLIGALFGIILMGFPGFLLGLFLGHQFDIARRRLYFSRGMGGFGSGGNPQAKQAAFFRNAFAVMGHMAKANGRVTEQEIRLATLFMDRMGLRGEARRQAQDAFREGKESDFPLDDVLDEVRQDCGGRSDLLQFFLELQIQSAYADGNLEQVEKALLYRIAEHLGYSHRQLDQRLRMQEAAFRFQQGGYHQHQSHGGGHYQAPPSRDQLADAYQLLGVEASATQQELKRAYRKQMNEHHPDKLVAKGLPPEMMEVAKQKAQEIQAAYDLIKKERGFK
ncbi:co-chaperone DjlA [Thaumasiovibrio subtropicus]|uniref:co-chaperone DjlA n=1 Tax=Thaumasiovibrio subtropicus TaxID=1891207 RepID=UPI000B34B5FA|nr:co-chaperone DjlA [Thaumasiovibrio subtropicus]